MAVVAMVVLMVVGVVLMVVILPVMVTLVAAHDDNDYMRAPDDVRRG